MPCLLVRTSPLPISTLVTIAGEVDLATTAELRAPLDALPDRDTVVEMSELRLLSAAGVTVLLELQARLATAGAHMVIAAAPCSVRRILAVLGLDARVPTAPTVQEAVDLLVSSAALRPVPTSALETRTTDG